MTVFKFRNLNSGQAMPVPPGDYLVGRLDECYVRVDDQSVSRNHAMLHNVEEGLFIEDLGSSNGTAFAGTYISTPVKLKVGDMLYIGSVPFRVDPEVSGQPEPVVSTTIQKMKTGVMSRSTERLPSVGQKPRVVEKIAPDKLAAPDVNPMDNDAATLNAVIMREPTAPASVRGVPSAPKPTPRPVPVATPVPAAQPVLGPVLGVAPKAKPASAPIKLKAASQALPGNPGNSTPKPVVSAHPLGNKVAAKTATAKAPTPLVPQASLAPKGDPAPAVQGKKMDWSAQLPAFLAGVGVGFVIGIVLAWIVL